jgi:hypothetical protein
MPQAGRDMASNEANRETAFKNTGAVEQDRPEQTTNVAPLDAQLDHRYQDPLNKQNDSGLAEKGQNPEFTGETQGRDELNQDTNTNQPDNVRRELQKDEFRTDRMDATNDTDQNAQNYNNRSQTDPKNDRSQGDTNVKPGSNRQDPDGNAEGILNDQDPGERQKENQGDKKDDDLAA